MNGMPGHSEPSNQSEAKKTDGYEGKSSFTATHKK